MTTAAYSVGNRVYNGASNAPTRGTVNPMGYINRSLGMSPVGGDGQSDKRSGLAAAALDRLRGGGMSASNPMSQSPPDLSALAPSTGSAGFTVSRTGQLIPLTPTPLAHTLQDMHGGPQGPSEADLMAAARERLSHHVQTKEMLTKHEFNMQKLHMKAAESINAHSRAVRGG